MVCSPVSHRTLLASTLVFAVGAAQAPAATLLDVNFDTTTIPGDQGYSYTYPGAVIRTGAAVGIDAGVGGSKALTFTANSTAASSSGFWGAAFSFTKPVPDAVDAATLGELAYSFDMSVVGGNSAATNLRIRLTLKDSGGDLLSVRNDVPFNATVAGFQTVTGDFGSGVVTAGSLANVLASTNPITAVFVTEFNGASGGFGYDAGNQFTIDNILVNTVPEPASLALVAAGGVALIRRRRR